MLISAHPPEQMVWLNKNELKSLLEALTSDDIEGSTEPFVCIRTTATAIGERIDVGLINIEGAFNQSKDITDYRSW